MGLFDKLKNVFFEEEYVEEEIKEEVKSKKEKVPVAKKIELPENKKSIEKEEVPEPAIVETDDHKEEVKRENSFRFPMNFEEEDFKEEKEGITLPGEKQKEVPIEEEIERHIEVDNTYARPYERREEIDADRFKSSPIISPIYGILDKNYRKEEIVTKKEIRLTTTTRRVDVDSVREKAYGDLASEINASITEEYPIEEDNLLYDLSEESSPAVSKVTVGDAEEYFADLGLEYNIDYKDTSKEIATGRRSKKEEPALIEEITEEKVEITTMKETKIEESYIEDNLFDLVDSMYEEKE